MASDSHTPTATTPEKPLENKVSEEVKLMENEIDSSDFADVVNDKPTSDSNQAVTKEEEIDQTLGGEPEKESHAEVEEVGSVVKAEEVTETEKDENGEKVAEQVELKELILVKEGVKEVIAEAVGAEKAEEKPTVESVVEEYSKNKEVESMVEEDNKDKEETKNVDVSESRDEAGGILVEPVDVQSIREVSAETAKDNIKDVETLEVEPKLEASVKVETQPEKAEEWAPEGEVVKAEETPETTEHHKVELEGELEDLTVKVNDSGINSKDEQTSPSGSGSALCPAKVVHRNQDSDTEPKKDTEGEASSPTLVIEKAINEENHVVKEPSKDEQESVTEAKDVGTKLATEDENIKKDTEPHVADGKTEKTLKETEAESGEKETTANKQEESITEKVTEVVETALVVKESDEPKQQQEAEVTTKEVAVKQKHSNSIISKVKQSLVKAKKAIIGKSPSSKTISTEEVKGDIKVK